MRLVIVGGQSRNVGKTGLVCDLIAALPEFQWTAVKITQFGHGVCGRSGRACDCACEGDGFRISRESPRAFPGAESGAASGPGRRRRGPGKDSARFLAAGAARSLWLRCRTGQLRAALPDLWRSLEAAAHVICESNTLAGFCAPAAFLLLVDPAAADYKPSARALLPRADLILTPPRPEVAALAAWLRPKLE